MFILFTKFLINRDIVYFFSKTLNKISILVRGKYHNTRMHDEYKITLDHIFFYYVIFYYALLFSYITVDSMFFEIHKQ